MCEKRDNLLRFSVPADFLESSLMRFEELNSRYKDRKVAEVYGQITTGRVTASGRMPDNLPQVDLKRLEKYIRQCRRYNIEFDYTLNASCMGNRELNEESREDVSQFLLSLDSAGVSSYTVALPALIDLIKQILPGRAIKASAICEINSVWKALHYHSLQVERIVVDPDITRRFDILRSICRNFGQNVEIIVNNACLRNCPYKMFHYNHEAHSRKDCSEKENRQFYYHKCSLQKAQDSSNYIKLNWIRPEDLHYYIETGIQRFKIHGRNYNNADMLIKVIEAYFSEKFDGNLMDLLTLYQPYNAFQPVIENNKLKGFLERFYRHPESCNEECKTCGYCMMYAAKSIDLDEMRIVNAYAKQLYENLLS